MSARAETCAPSRSVFTRTARTGRSLAASTRLFGLLTEHCSPKKKTLAGMAARVFVGTRVQGREGETWVPRTCGTTGRSIEFPRSTAFVFRTPRATTTTDLSTR